MFTKTCKVCGKIVEYETEEELRKHFYKKGNWFERRCIECTRKDHKKKYEDGQYNYRLRVQEKYQPHTSFGHCKTDNMSIKITKNKTKKRVEGYELHNYTLNVR